MLRHSLRPAAALPLALLALACASAPEKEVPATPEVDISPPAPMAAATTPAPAPEEPQEVAADSLPPAEPVPTTPTPSPWLAGPTETAAVSTVPGNQFVVKEPISFHTGKDTLRPESDPAIARVVEFLQTKPYVTLLRIEGHTDSLGDAQMNHLLSEKRALSLAKAIAKRGIDCRRLLAVGFGETKPIADNATVEGREKNRRMSFFTAALKGKPIGGMPVDGGGKIGGDACMP
jgi:OmpA-OmpF porin, OOP family